MRSTQHSADVDAGVLEMKPSVITRPQDDPSQEAAQQCHPDPYDFVAHPTPPIPVSSSLVRGPYTERRTNFKPTDGKFALSASKSPRPGSRLADLMEEVQKQEIAERIRELRKRSPLTQPQIAERMNGLTLRGYQKMEKVGTTKWERVQELAEIHNVDPELIWTGEAEVAPTDRLARMERKLDDLLARLEELALERDEEADIRQADASAETTAGREPARGSR